MEILILALLICYVVAWVFAMQIVTETAKAKGYSDITGKLWFIGLFGLPVTPAIIVSALPDKAGAVGSGSYNKVQDEIAKYKELQEQGVITEEEFQTKKEQLLKLV